MSGDLFFIPWRPLLEQGVIQAGGQILFTLTGTGTLAPVYSDVGLTTPRLQPVVADANGRIPVTYLDHALSYRVRFYARQAEAGVATPLEEYDPYVPGAQQDIAGLQAALASTAGGGMIGLPGGGTAADRLSGKAFGTLPAGATTYTPHVTTKTAQGNATDNSDWRADVVETTFDGIQGAAQVNGLNLRLRLLHSASTLSAAVAVQGYVTVGAEGQATTTGAVSNANWMQGHFSHTGSGSVAFAAVYSALGPDMDVGTGHLTKFHNYHSDDLSGGAASARIDTETFGYFQANSSIMGGTGLMAAFASEISGGTNRKNLYITGGADSNLAGKLSVGKVAVLGDSLEVSGFAKINRNGTPLTTGTRHEITSDNNDYVVDVFSSTASGPRGIHLKFTAAAPNDTTQDFLTCEDSSSVRMRIWSNGNLVNANNSYGAISDKRLKKNIRNARPQLADIRAIPIRRFRMKADGKHAKDMLGVVAQEVEKVSPGLVFEDGSKTKGVNYSILYMKAVKALQELADIVDAQGKQIAALVAK